MSTSPVTPDILQRMGVNLAPVPTIPSSPLNNTIASIPMPQGPTFGMALPSTTQTSADQARRDYLVNSGSGIDQITHPVDAQGNPTGQHVSWGKKLLGGVARAGEIAGSVFAPGVVAAIPGTALHHQFLVNQAANNVATDQAEDASTAATAEKNAQTGEVQALGDKASALAAADTPMPITAELAQAAGAPQLEGVNMTPKDYQKLVANHQTVAGRIQTNQTTNDTKQNISDDKIGAAADLAANKPMQRDDHYIQVMEKPAAQRTPEDLAFKQAYENYINTSKTQPGVARAVAGANARPLQVVLPNGRAGYEAAGTAMKTGATGLGDNAYKSEGKALTDFTSGSDSHTLTAFNTAQGHLKQLGAAADALDNGDIQGLNKIANAYGTATGQSAPAVFQGVKTAVSGEIAKAFTGAGATVDEINEVRKSINDAESPQQLHDVAASYSHLLDTKKGVLQDQLSSARKGQANFGGSASSGGKADYVFVPGKGLVKQ